MKINTTGIDKIDKYSSDITIKDIKRIKQNDKDSSDNSSEDKVELSSQALDLKEMQRKAMLEPDVRTDLVEKIKMKVNDGSYEINSQKIAEQLIDEAMGK